MPPNSPICHCGGEKRPNRKSCLVCQRKYNRTHYQANKSYYVAKSKSQTVRLKARIAEMKSKPCGDCGRSFPTCAMDFDHRGDKKFMISEAVARGARLARVLAEIAKCDVVCACCHRIRTHARSQAPVSPRSEVDITQPSEG